MDLVTNEHLDLLLAEHETGSTSFAASVLDGVEIGLYKTDVDLTRDTTLANLTDNEADYPGYGRQVCVWNSPSRGDDGAIEVVGIIDEFRPSSDTAPVTVFGLFGVLDADSSLGFCGRFDNPPVAMGDTHDAIVVTLRWRPTSGGLAVDVD